MPVIRCPNGKFRIGHGKCMYDSKEKAERAYKGYLYHKYGESLMRDSEAVKLKDFGVAVMIQNGVLMESPLYKDGSYDDTDWLYTTEPEKGFLQAAEKALGVKFKPHKGGRDEEVVVEAQTITDIKAEQAKSESKKNESTIDQQVKEFISQAKEDGGNSFTDDDSGDDVTVIWNDNKRSFSISVDRDEVNDDASESDVIKFLKPYFQYDKVVYESLASKLKKVCEEFDGTTLSSAGEMSNPLVAIVDPNKKGSCGCEEETCECGAPVEIQEAADLEAGFDLTDMPVKDWKELFDGLGLKPEAGKVVEKKSKGYKDQEYSSYYWKWENQGNEIRTTTNPFTGKHADPAREGKEIGYAGYIGLEGNATDIEHIYKFISDKGDWKDRSFGKADYV